MINPMEDAPATRKMEGLLAEYKTLRDEILRRVELRNTITFGTLTFAGALLSLGLENPSLPLIYVLISTFLAAAWVQCDTLISWLGQYIRENLECPENGLRWETFRHANRVEQAKKKEFRPTAVFSSGGVFLITQAVALLIALSQMAAFTALEWALGALAVAGLVLTAFFFRLSSRSEKTKA
ncbi:MAG TPA: hypothetical protein VIO36_07065 [Anaerolineaceae bacterium]